MTAWLTSIDRADTPQPAPVWFLWNEVDATALIYSPPTAKRLRRLAINPHSSLHLNDQREGHDFVVITGTIELTPGTPPASEHPGYTAKYTDWMTQVFGSPERFSSMFTVPWLFKATSVRGD